MNLHNNDTICAIITPPGNSAIGGVRLSGAETRDIVQSIFTPDHPTEKSSSREMCTGSCRLLFALPQSTQNALPAEAEHTISAILYRYIAPHSYTCEDVAEIFIPGSAPLLQALLRSILRHGARPAEPGEFTLRAFLNGRLTLGEAESVERLIHAQNESQRQQAANRLNGNFEKLITGWKTELLQIAGTIETVIDFDDEEIEEDLEADLKSRLQHLASAATELAQESTRQHQPCESGGIRIVLAGLTNSGKSSLLNALLAEDRAIISPERSTTRDHTEHTLKIQDIEFIIEDCPGIDIESSIIAAGATSRAKNRFLAGNILLLVLDSSNENNAELDALITHLPHSRALVVFNKSDLPQRLDKSLALETIARKSAIIASLSLSALTGDGIPRLLELLYTEGLQDNSQSGGIGISTREEEELFRTAQHAAAAGEALELGTEFASIELRESYEALTRLGGEGYAEDILENVFSRFCIGK